MNIQQASAAPALPPTMITDLDFVYVPSNNTDVMRTFRKFGWTEPDRVKQRETKRLLNMTEEDLVLA